MHKNFFHLLIFLCILACPCPATLLGETSIPANFGVNIHFVDKDLEQHISLLKEIGFGWVRKDLSWARVEREKGVYDFSRYDKLVSALNDAGIRVLLILNYSNPHYDNNLSPYTNRGRQAFKAFVTAAAKHYADKDVAWEIYNEPNWKFWRPTPHVQNYIALANIVTKALHESVPHQMVMGPALAGPTNEPKRIESQYAFLDAVLGSEAAKTWQAITVHPYRGFRAPEDVFKDAQKLSHMLKKRSISAPLVFSEWGYHTAEKGVDEKTEAAYAARSFLITASLHMPFSIWYNWQEIGDNYKDSEEKYGLVRYGDIDPDDDNIRKPAFLALRELTQLLGGYRFDGMITTKTGVYVLRFTDGKHIAYAMWNTAKEPIAYFPMIKKGKWRVKHLLNEEDAFENINDQQPSLQLDQMPTILTEITR